MTQKIYRDGTDQYVMTRFGGIDPDTGAQSILLGESEGDSLDIENLVIVWSEYKKEGEAITPPVITWDSSAGMWKILIPHGNITQYGSAWLNISGTAMIPVAIEVETVHEDTYYATDADITAMRAIIDLLMADVSSLATSAEITALNDLSAQQVWEYASRGLTAIPTGTATATALSAVQGDITSIKSTVEGISVVGGTGAEKVIPRTYYELSAVANTITLSSPYDTITEEQIISICDLTTGDVIYSCEIPIKHTISVSSGVITFTYDNNSIAAEDILQIIVNQV